MPGQPGSAAPFNAKYFVEELSPEIPNASLLLSITLLSGLRFYFKNSSGTKIASIDENGNLRIKGSVYENQSSV